MLEYAANAVVYWSVEAIRAQFNANCTDQGLESEQVLGESLGADADEEQFWQKAKTNLQAGKIRLVFVADEIPTELRRIVEFLSAQMDPAEVLALEIKQYVGEGLRTLVPRMVGQTAARPPARQWDETSFFQELQRRDADEAEVARKVLDWAKEKDLWIFWGKGKQFGTFSPAMENRPARSLIVVWTIGYIQINFGYMPNLPPFDDETKRLEFLKRLNEIPGVDIPADAITKFPNITSSALKDEPILQRFLETLDWVVQQIKAA